MYVEVFNKYGGERRERKKWYGILTYKVDCSSSNVSTFTFHRGFTVRKRDGCIIVAPLGGITSDNLLRKI